VEQPLPVDGTAQAAEKLFAQPTVVVYEQVFDGAWVKAHPVCRIPILQSKPIALLQQRNAAPEEVGPHLLDG